MRDRGLKIRDERSVTGDGREATVTPSSRIAHLSSLVLAVVLALAAGCQQDMADQPSYKPLDGCSFFADGRSARPLVPGTVARGYLKADTAFWTGRRPLPSGDQDPDTGLTPADMKAALQPNEPKGPGGTIAPIDEKKLYAPFVDAFPIPITEKVVQHGYNRFMIYCVVCHDPLGTGHGRIVERGYTQPPSYHIERLRRAPVGHLFAVISEGYGSMPSYANQIPVRDRWAIVAYIKALQASQHWPSTMKDEGTGRKDHPSSLIPHSSSLISHPSSPPGVNSP
jgi:mono/diheme cytochrome c family protein